MTIQGIGPCLKAFTEAENLSLRMEHAIRGPLHHLHNKVRHLKVLAQHLRVLAQHLRVRLLSQVQLLQAQVKRRRFLNNQALHLLSKTNQVNRNNKQNPENFTSQDFYSL